MSKNQLRRSQLLTSFGPGALVDLPENAVIVSGTEHWHYDNQNIPFVEEPRLVAKLMSHLAKNGSPVKSLALRLPPVQEDERSPKAGVWVFEFPEWFVVQATQRTKHGATRRRLIHKKDLDSKRRFLDPDTGKKASIVPMRFVQACNKGHIDDVSWREFVHGNTPCAQPLWVEEIGTSGALSDMRIVCQCGKERKISEVYAGRTAIGNCTGERPWLGAGHREACTDTDGKPTPAKILLRGASNAHFPQVLSVISIPDLGSALEKAVDAQWHILQAAGSRELLTGFLAIPLVKAALSGFVESDIWKAIKARRDGVKTQADRPVKEVEFEAFLQSASSGSENLSSPDFLVRKLDSRRWESLRRTGLVENVILVDKLREVAAMVGFTRLAPASNEINGELNDQVIPAPIHQNPDWFPVREIRGEGVFLQFNPQAIKSWLERSQTKARAEVMDQAVESWRRSKGDGAIMNPGLAYSLLHSLSHLLMTSIALECGYPASAMKERIYCLEQGYGILIFTGSNDVDGTLGGLVQSGEDIERHLLHALQSAELCSSDPVCAHHSPDGKDDRPLQGAACHGCLFIPETSCEQRNEFLDRTLVVETVDAQGCEFFTAAHLALLDR